MRFARRMAVTIIGAATLENPDGSPRLRSAILGRRFEWTTELTEFDRPRRSSSRSVEGKLQFTVTILLEPADGGTRFTYRVDAASGLGGVFGRLADPFVERAQARTVRANLETLAELLRRVHKPEPAPPNPNHLAAGEPAHVAASAPSPARHTHMPHRAWDAAHGAMITRSPASRGFWSRSAVAPPIRS